MAAQEDSLPPSNPITAAADRSESTTLLVSKGSGLPGVLQQAFHDGARPTTTLGSPGSSIAVDSWPRDPRLHPIRSH